MTIDVLHNQEILAFNKKQYPECIFNSFLHKIGIYNMCVFFMIEYHWQVDNEDMKILSLVIVHALLTHISKQKILVWNLVALVKKRVTN